MASILTVPTRIWASAVGVPALVGSVVLWMHAVAIEGEAIQGADEHLARLAEVQATELSEFLGSREVEAMRIASDPAVIEWLQDAEADEVPASISRALEAAPAKGGRPGRAVALLDIRGVPLRTLGDAGLLDDAKVAPLVAQAVASPESQIVLAEANGRGPSFLALAPVREEGGRATGFVVLSTPATAAVAMQVGEAIVGPSETWALVDRKDGRVLLTSGRGHRRGALLAATYTGLDRIGAASGSPRPYRAPDGAEVYGRVAPIAGQDWVVLAEVNRSTVIAGADVRLAWSLLVLVGVLGGSLGLGWWLSRGVFDWVERLNDTMQRFGAGDHDARADEGDHVQFSETVRRFNALADYVQQSHAALEEARAEAEQHSEAKSAFLANMSHEIRTPLTALVGFTQVLHRDKALTETQRQHVESILRAGRHLADLVNDVLEMSKVEAGRTTVDLRQVSLHDVLEEVHGLFALAAANKGLELEVCCREGLPSYLLSDRRKVRQVLINLVGNAVKMTAKGRVSVVAHCLRESDEIAIDVTDTGVGIAGADQERIFQAFDQGGSMPAVSGGTGLGLSISRRYAELLGGSLTVESEVGVGSTFRLVLKDLRVRAAVDFEEQTGPVQCVSSGIGGLQILLVDDDSGVASAVSHLIAIEGGQVEAARSGEEALAMFAPYFDLVVMDLRMAGMGGLEAIRRIRALPGGGNVGIVAMSGATGDGESATALAAGADHFLAKPFDLEMLQEKAVLAVRKRRSVERPEQVHRTGDSSSLVAALATVPVDRLEALAEFALEGDICALRDGVADLRDRHPEVAQLLEPLVQGFNYERIVELCSRS